VILVGEIVAGRKQSVLYHSPSHYHCPFYRRMSIVVYLRFFCLFEGPSGIDILFKDIVAYYNFAVNLGFANQTLSSLDKFPASAKVVEYKEYSLIRVLA
jgi:hypothetical protein